MKVSVSTIEAARSAASIMSEKLIRIVWVYRIQDRDEFRLALGSFGHRPVGYAIGDEWVQGPESAI